MARRHRHKRKETPGEEGLRLQYESLATTERREITTLNPRTGKSERHTVDVRVLPSSGSAGAAYLTQAVIDSAGKGRMRRRLETG